MGGWFGADGQSKASNTSVLLDGWFRGDSSPEEDLVDWNEFEDDSLWVGEWRDDETEPRF